MEPDLVKLLFIVDVQNDFVTGSLAVPDAQAAVHVIEDLIYSGEYTHIWASKDYHPPTHFSFSDDPQYVDGSWPPHCVKGTKGALFASDEITKAVQKTFYKGEAPDVEAYSAFDGHDYQWRTLRESLEQVAAEVHEFHVVGLALDYCVKATAMDACRFWFPPTVLVEATRPVSYASGVKAVAEMALQGVVFE